MRQIGSRATIFERVFRVCASLASADHSGSYILKYGIIFSSVVYIISTSLLFLCVFVAFYVKLRVLAYIWLECVSRQFRSAIHICTRTDVNIGPVFDVIPPHYWS